MVVSRMRLPRRTLVAVSVFTAAAVSLSAFDTQLDFTTGWTSNIAEDATGAATATGGLHLGLSGAGSTKAALDSWRVDLTTDGAFAVNGENSIVSEAAWQHGFRFTDGVLFAGLGVLHALVPEKTKSGFDDVTWTHAGGDAFVALRLEGDDSSLQFRYAFRLVSYPDNDLDQQQHGFSLEGDLDLDQTTSLNLALSATGTRFVERARVDAAGAGTDDGVVARDFGATLRLTHWFAAALGLKLDAGFARKASNANLYFFGPNETVFVSDGDERVFDDFDSRNTWHAGCSVRGETGMLVLQFGVACDLIRFDERPAFSAADVPLAQSVRTTRLSASAEAGLNLSEGTYLFALLDAATADSNDAKTDMDLFAARAGVRFLF